jgi:hypothetical protein
MLVFLPYADYEKTARVLHWSTLQSQIFNNLSLMRSFTKIYDIRCEETQECGWSHGLSGLFWMYHELQLAKFTVALTRETLRRPLPTTNQLESLTSRKNMHSAWVDLHEELEIRGFPEAQPSLIGDPAFHSATRAYLKYKEQERLTFRMWKKGLFSDHACHRDNLPRKASWVREDYIRLWKFFNPPALRWYSRWGWTEKPDDSLYYITEDRLPLLEYLRQEREKYPMSPSAARSYARGQRNAIKEKELIKKWTLEEEEAKKKEHEKQVYTN